MPAPDRAAPGRQGGFSLVEALVALALLGGALSALYSLQSANSRALARTIEAEARRHDMRNAFELVRAINPAQAPEGTMTLGASEVGWSARLIAADSPSGRTIPGRAVWRVGLYEVQVEVWRSGERAAQSLTLRQAGWMRQTPAAP